MLLRRVVREAAAYRWYVAAIFLLGLLAAPITLLTPLPLKIAVDNVLGSQPLPGAFEAVLPDAWTASKHAILMTAVGLVVFFTLLNQLQWAVSWLLSTYTGEKLVLGFRSRLFQHVQRLSLAYHDANGSTDATYRVQYDAPAVQWIVIDSLIPLITSALKLAGMITVMFLLDPAVAGLALLVAPVLYGLTRYYRQHLRQRWRDVKKLESSAMSVVQEVVSALRVVKAFGQEEREHGRFVAQSDRGLGARLRVTVWECTFGILIGLTTALGTAMVLWVGVRHVEQGLLSLGELLLLMAYLSQLYEPLKSLSKNVTGLQKSLASAERVFELIDQTPDIIERPHARPVKRALGRFQCRDLSFAYPGHPPVLHDVSFEVPEGSRVGILGPTGAGKTTLINLITRLYDPNQGAILLDDVDLRDYRIADLRKQFAIVLQDPVLLSTTVEENIAYARPDATEAEILAAARSANALEFISQMPQGFKTQVGERGLRLSGGERQRISIARAFLLDAPILILDEPTSSVDGKTEAGILEAMERLMQGRTTFMIAHRLSTLRQCDLLIKIVDGQIVEQTAEVAKFLSAEEQTWQGGARPSLVSTTSEAGGK
jgi:ATP-binding cassette subfamily B protein